MPGAILSAGRTVHELSIMQSVVAAAVEALAEHPGARVQEVRMQVGEWSGVVEEALQFCFEVAARDTILEGASLVVRRMPVVIHCAACGTDEELAGVQSLRCPRCGELSGDLRQGRELAIESLQIKEP